jgi:hypothetical protein
MDPMDVDPASVGFQANIIYHCSSDPNCFYDCSLKARLGLPEEILVMIFLGLGPADRRAVAGVSSTWNRLAKESWLNPYGEISDALGFHSLATGKILRQCIRHVVWSVPDLRDIPCRIPVYSKPFNADFSDPESSEKDISKWRLVLVRSPSTISPETPDLYLKAECLRCPKEVTVLHHGRVENPASYSWADFRTGTTPNVRAGSVVDIISSDIQDITNPTKGFFLPSPNNTTIQFKVLLSRRDVESVAVFTEDDCVHNTGPDLFQPTQKTMVLHMQPGWMKDTGAEAQKKLKRAMKLARRNCDLARTEFWRVIMRRNHSFRPISKELRSYEEPFYAVFAHDVRPQDAEKTCLFFKHFDGKQLKYLCKRFAGPHDTLRSILRNLNNDYSDHLLFEEVHSRRLDKMEQMDVEIGNMELGNGDVLVICAREHVDDLQKHYQSLVYTSPLVTIQPNMWHT